MNWAVAAMTQRNKREKPFDMNMIHDSSVNLIMPSKLVVTVSVVFVHTICT